MRSLYIAGLSRIMQRKRVKSRRSVKSAQGQFRVDAETPDVQRLAAMRGIFLYAGKRLA
jgi:hypothetical protein